jgi:hypothetical protein
MRIHCYKPPWLLLNLCADPLLKIGVNLWSNFYAWSLYLKVHGQFRFCIMVRVAPRSRQMARSLALLLALQTAAASAVYDDFTTYNSSVCKQPVTTHRFQRSLAQEAEGDRRGGEALPLPLLLLPLLLPLLLLRPLLPPLLPLLPPLLLLPLPLLLLLLGLLLLLLLGLLLLGLISGANQWGCRCCCYCCRRCCRRRRCCCCWRSSCFSFASRAKLC